MSLSLHIRHEVRPERMQQVLYALVEGVEFDHVIQGARQVARLRQLDLLEGDIFTEDARHLIELTQDDEAVWGEVLHYLHYTKWSSTAPTDNGFSWLYRHFSDFLWEMGAAPLDPDFLNPAVSFFINKVEESSWFEAEDMQKAAVSLSPDSLRGALHFFGTLNPSVIEDGVFTRRHFCSPVSILLAVGWVAQNSEAEIGIDMLLTPKRRDALCRLCLLELSALDQSLDWMLPIYPDVVEPGTTAGIYGRFLRFHKWPELSDLSARRR